MPRPNLSRCAAALAAALLLLAPTPGRAFLDDLFGPEVDPALVARVPPEKCGAIKKADYAFACAERALAVAEAKEDLADRKGDLAALGTKLAKAQAQGAHLDLNIAKMQAVIEAGLGDRDETTKALNDLQVRRTENAADVTQLKIKIEEARGALADQTRRVAEKERDAAEFEGLAPGTQPGAAPAPVTQTQGTQAQPAAGAAAQNDAQTGAAQSGAAQAADGVTPPVADESNQTVIVNKEPAPPAEAPVPAAPETNLGD